MRRNAITTALAAALSVSSAMCVAANERTRQTSPEAPARTGSQFYPNQVEGGVTGNYSFNNQIRKHTDPLNANGGK